MYKAIIIATLLAATSAQFLPNGCPSDFTIHLLLPHETDCAKFYQCRNGNKVEMTCGPGTLFDSNLQVCNWPFAVQCPTTPGPTTTVRPSTTTTVMPSTTTHLPSSGFLPNGCPSDFTVHHLLPHESDCSMFYSCRNGQKIPMSCAPGTWFDFDLQGCNWPDQVPEIPTTQAPTTDVSTDAPTTNDSTYGPSTDHSTTDFTTTDDYSTSTTEDYTSDYSSTTTDPPTTEAFDPCPPGTVGHVPHPDLCDSFYLCLSGIAVQLYCPVGYEFDKEIRSCVEIAEGGCTLGPIVSSTVNPSSSDSYPSTTDGSPTTPDGSITTTDPGTTPDLCPVGVWGNIPHPTLCNSFFMCAAGNAIQLFCSDGFEFDPILKKCVEIAEGGCTLSSTTTTPIPESTTLDPVTQICPPGTVGNVPDPEACESFYMCAGGHAIKLFCSDGFEFDPTSRRCVEIAEGGCTLSSGTTTPGSGTSTTSDSSESTTEGLSTTSNPDTGNTESTTDKVTATDVPTTTESGTPKPDVCPPGVWGNVPHPTQCNSFYVCAGDDVIQVFCNEGFEFDPLMRECVPIAEGGCTLSGTTPVAIDITSEGFQSTTDIVQTSTESESVPTTKPGPDTTTDSTETTEQGSTVEPESTSTENLSTTTDADTTENPLCHGVYGKIPHPNLCNAFYMCTGDEAQLMFCEDGLEFDSETKTCVAISESGCTSQQGTTTDSDTVSTTETITTTPEDIETTISGETTSESTEVTSDVTQTTTEDLDPTVNDSTSSDSVETTSEITEASSAIPDTTSGETVSTTEGIETTTPEELNICPPGVHGNLPHPTLCDSYYLCLNGIPVQLFCANDFEYDSTLQTCVPIAKGGCTLGSATTKSPDSNLIQTTPGGEHVTPDSTETTTAAPQICPLGIFGYVPHPELCNSFYMCTAGNAIQLFCSEGFEFNPAIKDCEVISEGGCTHQSLITTEPPSSEDASTEKGSDTSTENVPEICPPDVWGNVPHPELCDSFYMCASGNAIQLFCTDGYEFNPELRTCVMIEEGGCTLGSPTTPDSSGSVSTESGSTGSGSTESGSTGSGSTESGSTGSGSTGSGSTESGSTDVSTESESTDTSTESGSTDTSTDASTESGSTGTSTESGSTDSGSTDSGSTDSGSTDSGSTDSGSTDSGSTDTSTESGSTGTSTESGSTDSGSTGTSTESVSTGSGSTDSGSTESGSTGTSTQSGSTGASTSTEDDDDLLPEDEANPTTEGESSVETFTTEASITVNPVDTTSEETSSSSEDSSTTEGNTTTQSSSEDVNSESTTELSPTTAYPHYSSTDSSTTINPASTTEVSDDASTEGSGSTPESNESTDQSSEAPEKPFVCPVGVYGNVPHPDYCDSYYLCIGGDPILLSCADGYEYDPELKQCVEIKEGGCTLGPATSDSVETTSESLESTGTTSGPIETTSESTVPSICPDNEYGYYPHPEKCDAFYICVNGESILLFCGEGSEYSPELKDCVAIAKGGCTLGSVSTTTSDAVETTAYPTPSSTVSEPSETTTTTEVSESGSESPETTAAPVETTTVAESSSKSSETTVAPVETTTEDLEETTPAALCPVDGINSYVPHPDMCNAFVLCDDNKEVVLYCSEGLEFDTISMSCVEIVEGGCTLGSSQPPSETTTKVPTTTQSPIETESITDDIEETETTVAPTEETELSTTTSTAPTTIADDETEAVSTTTAAPAICPPGIPWINIPHPELCDSYYMCASGHAIQLYCRDGYEFNPTTSECVEIAEGGCTWNAKSAIATAMEVKDRAAAIICPRGASGNIADPTRCDAYYSCTRGNAILLYCADGYEYDSKVKSCVEIAEGGCTLRSKTTTVAASTTTTGTPTTTTGTPTTTTGTPITTTGTPTTTKETPTTTTGTPTTTTGTPTTTTGTPTTTTGTPTSQSADTTTISSAPISESVDSSAAEKSSESNVNPLSWEPAVLEKLALDGMCRPGVYGNIPDPENCGSYYFCAAGRATPMKCDDGYEFDIDTRSCVTIREGGCTSKLIEA